MVNPPPTSNGLNPPPPHVARSATGTLMGVVQRFRYPRPMKVINRPPAAYCAPEMTVVESRVGWGGPPIWALSSGASSERVKTTDASGRIRLSTTMKEVATSLRKNR